MRIKSLMLTPVLLGLTGSVGYALYQIAAGAPPVVWVGVLMAAGPLPLFVAYLMAFRTVARTSTQMLPALSTAFGGVVVTLMVGMTLAPIVLAVVSFGALLWYIFVYSKLDRPSSDVLMLGGQLPDFALKDASGRVVHASEFRGHPALFIFFRGNWCPLCMAQIREVAEGYNQLIDQGVEVVLISPQPALQTRRLAERYEVPFRYLVDTDLTASQSLGIAAKGGVPLGVDLLGYGSDTVMPTIIATDASGMIIFLDETDNYRVRPEPETFLSIFEDMAGPTLEVA